MGIEEETHKLPIGDVTLCRNGRWRAKVSRAPVAIIEYSTRASPNMELAYAIGRNKGGSAIYISKTKKFPENILWGGNVLEVERLEQLNLLRYLVRS